jgi:hypothetical protein
MEDNFWNDEMVIEFTNWSLKHSPIYQGRYADIEQFKKSKEVVKTEYKILSFIYNYKVVVAWQGEDNHCGLNYKQWVDGCINYNYPIHSVRRLSDGEVFTIGDNTDYGVINRFEIKGDKYATLFAAFNDSCIMQSIKSIEKVKPKVPLFQSTDMVDIFDQQSYYGVNDEFNILACCAHKTMIDFSYRNCSFSTRQKAEEWIIWNKPHLSLAEVMATSNWYDGNEVSERRIFGSTDLRKLSAKKINS